MINRRMLLGSSLAAAALAVRVRAQPYAPDAAVIRDVHDMLKTFYDAYNTANWAAIKRSSIHSYADGLRFGTIVNGPDKIIDYLKELHSAGYRYSASFDQFGVWVPDRDLAIALAQQTREGCQRLSPGVDECAPAFELHVFRFDYPDEVGAYPKIRRLVFESWF